MANKEQETFEKVFGNEADALYAGTDALKNILERFAGESEISREVFLAVLQITVEITKESARLVTRAVSNERISADFIKENFIDELRSKLSEAFKPVRYKKIDGIEKINNIDSLRLHTYIESLLDFVANVEEEIRKPAQSGEAANLSKFEKKLQTLRMHNASRMVKGFEQQVEKLAGSYDFAGPAEIENLMEALDHWKGFVFNKEFRNDDNPFYGRTMQYDDLRDKVTALSEDDAALTKETLKDLEEALEHLDIQGKGIERTRYVGSDKANKQLRAVQRNVIEDEKKKILGLIAKTEKAIAARIPDVPHPPDIQPPDGGDGEGENLIGNFIERPKRPEGDGKEIWTKYYLDKFLYNVQESSGDVAYATKEMIDDVNRILDLYLSDRSLPTDEFLGMVDACGDFAIGNPPRNRIIYVEIPEAAVQLKAVIDGMDHPTNEKLRARLGHEPVKMFRYHHFDTIAMKFSDETSMSSDWEAIVKYDHEKGDDFNIDRYDWTLGLRTSKDPDLLRHPEQLNYKYGKAMNWVARLAPQLIISEMSWDDRAEEKSMRELQVLLRTEVKEIIADISKRGFTERTCRNYSTGQDFAPQRFEATDVEDLDGQELKAFMEMAIKMLSGLGIRQYTFMLDYGRGETPGGGLQTYNIWTKICPALYFRYKSYKQFVLNIVAPIFDLSWEDEYDDEGRIKRNEKKSKVEGSAAISRTYLSHTFGYERAQMVVGDLTKDKEWVQNPYPSLYEFVILEQEKRRKLNTNLDAFMVGLQAFDGFRKRVLSVPGGTLDVDGMTVQELEEKLIDDFVGKGGLLQVEVSSLKTNMDWFRWEQIAQMILLYCDHAMLVFAKKTKNKRHRKRFLSNLRNRIQSSTNLAIKTPIGGYEHTGLLPWCDKNDFEGIAFDELPEHVGGYTFKKVARFLRGDKLPADVFDLRDYVLNRLPNVSSSAWVRSMEGIRGAKAEFKEFVSKISNRAIRKYGEEKESMLREKYSGNPKKLKDALNDLNRTVVALQNAPKREFSGELKRTHNIANPISTTVRRIASSSLLKEIGRIRAQYFSEGNLDTFFKSAEEDFAGMAAAKQDDNPDKK